MVALPGLKAACDSLRLPLQEGTVVAVDLGPDLVALVAPMGDPWQGGDAQPVVAPKIHRVLAVAAQHGCTELVLGAWGCGAGKFPAADVAAAFKSSLAHRGGAFRGAVFAIPPSHVARLFDRAFQP
jgi:uncharacterized protein (TIGR02452 family)